MKILIDVHGWPPELPAGAERMLQSIATWLEGRGHELAIIATAGPRPATREERDAEDLYAWADVVITHLDRTSRVIRMADRAERRRIPVVHVVHNADQLAFHHVTPAQAALVVWNAENTRSEAAKLHGTWQGREIVVRPPVWPGDYLTEHPGPDTGRVTLVNLNENKGGRLLDRMARLAPGMRFLGVRGGYGRQYLSRAANVENIDSAEDMREVYGRTAILIVPSRSETYGRVAVEAAVSGIPTVAADLPGIREAMGAGALYVPELVPGLWIRRIRQVAEDYATWSRRAAERAAAIDPEPELIALEEELVRLAGRPHALPAEAQPRRVDRTPRTRGRHDGDPIVDEGRDAVPTAGRRGSRAGARSGDDAPPARGTPEAPRTRRTPPRAPRDGSSDPLRGGRGAVGTG